jgi:aryl-alcohol dehydrogenase-like predicted oxidoreductase
VGARTFFDAIARRYDRAYALSGPLSRARLARVVRELEGRTRVLVLGIGTGRELPALLDAGHEPVGLDVSPEMIAQCSHRARRVPIVLGDFYEPLPFGDASFDAAIALHGTLAHPPHEGAHRALASHLPRDDELRTADGAKSDVLRGSWTARSSTGINFFDTANVYGWKKGEGLDRADRRPLVREQGGGRREKVVIATKVYGDMGDWPNQSRLSALHIVRACEASLRRLQTDYIDLYQMHHIDRDCPVGRDLAGDGECSCAGQGDLRRLVELRRLAHRPACQRGQARHFMGLVSEQSLYNLDRSHRSSSRCFPACRHYGLGLIPWSPLKGGILGGAAEEASRGAAPRSDGAEGDREARGPQLERYEALCDTLGEEPATWRWRGSSHNPVVTAPIIGPRTMDQLESAVRALDVTLEESTIERARCDLPRPRRRGPRGLRVVACLA